jgi:hypothetical protein
LGAYGCGGGRGRYFESSVALLRGEVLTAFGWRDWGLFGGGEALGLGFVGGGHNLN